MIKYNFSLLFLFKTINFLINDKMSLGLKKGKLGNYKILYNNSSIGKLMQSVNLTHLYEILREPTNGIRPYSLYT